MTARRGWRPVAATVLVAAAALTLSTASASGLPMSGGGVSIGSAQACASAPVTLTKTEPITLLWWVLGYRGVQLTGIPAGCAGLPLELTVHDASGAGVQTTFVAAAASAGTMNLSTGGDYGGVLNSAPAYAMTIAGWSVPVSG